MEDKIIKTMEDLMWFKAIENNISFVSSEMNIDEENIKAEFIINNGSGIDYYIQFESELSEFSVKRFISSIDKSFSDLSKLKWARHGKYAGFINEDY